MDKNLFDLVDQQVPKFNRRVVNGLPVEELRQVESYIDGVMRTAAREMAPDLVYERMERASYMDEYREIVRKGGSRNTTEHSRSDMYMVKLHFKLRGEPLPPRLLFLPFTERGGFITIRGSKFIISPVMADKAISVGHNYVFVPMAWDRKNFFRLTQYFYADDVQEAIDVVWSKIHNYTRKDKRSNSKMDVKANTVLAHYLFAKYGLTRAFSEMANANVVCGSSRDITEERYPKDEWMICRSMMFKPRSVRDPNYVGPDARLAVKRSEWSPSVASLVAGFFYVADYFPDRVVPDEVDEPRLWRILLGYIIYGPGLSEGKLAEDINYHIGSLDSYIETQTRLRLADIGVYVEDIYQLFMHLIEKFDYYINQSSSSLSSTYGKRLLVLPYALSDLTWAIHRLMFNITSLMKRKPLTKEDVIKHMNKTLSPTTAFRMNKMHREVNPIAISGDNIYFKGTSHVVLQESSSGSKARSSTEDPTKILHVSVAEAGSYSTPSKSEPTGREKLNPCITVSPDSNEIKQNPNLKELLDATQRMIQRDS